MKLITRHLMAVALLLSTVWTAAGAAPDTMQRLDNKLSISTQMFLDEMQGDLTFDEPAPSRLNAPGQT